MWRPRLLCPRTPPPTSLAYGHLSLPCPLACRHAGLLAFSWTVQAPSHCRLLLLPFLPPGLHLAPLPLRPQYYLPGLSWATFGKYPPTFPITTVLTRSWVHLADGMIAFLPLPPECKVPRAGPVRCSQLPKNNAQCASPFSGPRCCQKVVVTDLHVPSKSRTASGTMPGTQQVAQEA